MNIIVLGMHRSGTSVVTRALGELGCFIGEPKDLLPPQEDNPEGFWERADVVTLNDEILSAAGCSWYNPVGFHVENIDPDRYVKLSQRAKQIISALDQHNTWVIKDPRICITWPVWGEFLSDIVIVYVNRTCSSVASSLAARNSIPLSYGSELWNVYSQSAINCIKENGYKFIGVDYDDLRVRQGLVLHGLSDKLKKIGVRIDVNGDTDSVWNENLYHQESGVAVSGDELERIITSYIDSSVSDLSELGIKDLKNSERILTEMSDCVGKSINSAHFEREYENILSDRNLLLEKYKKLESDHADLSSAYRQKDNSLTETINDRNSLLDNYRTLESDSQEKQIDLECRNFELQESNSCLKASNEKLECRIDSLDKDISQLEKKSDYLFFTLRNEYKRISDFKRSIMGSAFFILLRAYRLLTFRRGKVTAIEGLLLEARNHVNEHGDFDNSHSSSRLSMLLQVMRYIVRHPHAAIQNFSFYRLKRLLSVVFLGNSQDASMWASERFPKESVQYSKPIIFPADESCDSLELNFSVSEDPVVSIIVPVYNQYRMTVSCLKSVFEHTSDVAYEIIIGDDCSSDLTQTMSERIKGITVVRNEENLGFLKNCNNAASFTKGRYVLFLNNDTNVQPGWLSSLLSLTTQDEKIGLIGPKLLFEDGVLQEAGGIIWNDASGWNYGRGQSPQLPEFNYVRETDYISGACIMIPVVLWEKLGGFDEYFCPAYYEDTDFAFQVREHGYKVIYQPASEVVHFEGVSHGSDVSQGVKKNQVINQKKFYNKWESTLKSENLPNAVNVFKARGRSKDRLSVLVIDHYVPHFDKDAGSKSTYLYLKVLVDMGADVKFLGANFFPHQPYTSHLEQLGIEVLHGEYYAKNWQSWLAENALHIDVIYLHRPHIAEQFLPGICSLPKRPKLIYFGHDLHYLRAKRQAEIESEPSLLDESKQWREKEFSIFDQVDQVYYPSQVEIDEIQSVKPSLIARSIPLYALGYSGASYTHGKRKDLLFVGGFNHQPNVDAVNWFVRDVLPTILRINSDVVLHVVGSNVPESIRQLESSNVKIHGFLSDEELKKRYSEVRLVVAPLRYGAGVKGKIIEALHYGLPVVTTPIGAEGIPNPLSVMKVESGADKFANAVLSLYQDSSESEPLVNEMRPFMERYYSKEAVSVLIDEDFFGSEILSSAECEAVV